jgi:soluble lytic murein transglycosylase
MAWMHKQNLEIDRRPAPRVAGALRSGGVLAMSRPFSAAVRRGLFVSLAVGGLSLGAGDVRATDDDRAPAATGSVNTGSSLFGGLFGGTSSNRSSGNTSAEGSEIRVALDHVRRGRTAEATAARNAIADPVGRKLIEWAILRSDNNTVSDSDRYIAFARDNPTWPSIAVIRRRGEAGLWEGRASAGEMRAALGTGNPTSAKGKLAAARIRLDAGDRAGATTIVRETWRNDQMGESLEREVLETFGSLLTPADHRARMDDRLNDEDFDGAARAASRVGGAAPAIVRAREAVHRKQANAGALLEAVPQAARKDPAFIFARAQWLRRQERGREAAPLLAQADPRAGNNEEWWDERRSLVRRLLDENDPAKAYQVAAGNSAKDYRSVIEAEFLAGWIALRFLNRPQDAARHFTKLMETGKTPVTESRALYWLGRARQAAGDQAGAARAFQQAGRYTATFYGQLARDKSGLNDLPIRSPAAVSGSDRAAFQRLEVIRALDMLYDADARDMTLTFHADMVRRFEREQDFALLADVASRNRDARALVMIGKAANQKGLPFDSVAWPTFGLPDYTPLGPDAGKAVAYAIARQESEFNMRTLSSANAMGLMQITPTAGRYMARKFGFEYSENRIRTDAEHNTAVGAVQIGDLLRTYDGSLILSFAAYNAGQGRVRDWIAKYGDPRQPNVDPIDWIERIPFAETRNYVQRVMENLQVYRVRFGQSSRLTIEADLKRGATQ